jgi:hypothetical protein
LPGWLIQAKAGWRQTFNGIIATGEALQVGHGSMERLAFEQLVERELGFSPSMARKLMVIAKDQRLSCHVAQLPPSWTILYEITKLDDETFDAMTAEGSINPTMTKLVADNAVWLEKHRQGHRTKKKGAFQKFTLPRRSIYRSPEAIEAGRGLMDLAASLAANLKMAPSIDRAVMETLTPKQRQLVAESSTEICTWFTHVIELCRKSVAKAGDAPVRRETSEKRNYHP